MITQPRQTVRYKIWKQPLYKWDAWVSNKHKVEKTIDDWSAYIVDNCNGSTAVYDSGGLFFTDFIPDITVIEYTSMPIKCNSQVHFVDKGADFDSQFDNLIMIQPLTLKLDSSLAHAIASPGLCRRGPKPDILKWLKPDAKIFVSMSDWNFYFNRLKYSVDDFVDQQIEDLKNIGISCLYKSVTDVSDDIENGNIKLVLSVQKSV